MMLGELIDALEAAVKAWGPNRIPRLGFRNPHSYRGVYVDLAFEPAEDVTLGEMLAAARGAVGATYTGWKGGEFTMTRETDVHLAEIGCGGEEIGPHFLALMLEPK